ncbi:MAG: hypothetical protein P9L92_19205 [Candidatus Electryonea clarkiae]|nr:hypothetical protein [Candidatus Electryonea clarkiae]MDP8287389.1 hypothetical protein [Candidatus Electryonea clarkiae]
MNEGKFAFQGGYASELNYLAKTELDYGAVDTFIISSEFPTQSYIFSGAIQYGFTERLDFMVDVFTSFTENQRAPGVKLLMKYQLSTDDSRVTYAAMPVIGLSIGSWERAEYIDDDWVEIESDLSDIEFHMLMSYRHSYDAIVTIGSWATMLKHNTYSSGKMSSISWNENIKDLHVFPGISLGLHYERTMYEINIARIDNNLYTTFGLAARF